MDEKTLTTMAQGARIVLARLALECDLQHQPGVSKELLRALDVEGILKEEPTPTKEDERATDHT